MTLLLTELGEAGIVMGSDSAITFMDNNGMISDIKKTGWDKVLKFHNPKALIGYWGTIGEVSGEIPFDRWIRQRLEGQNFQSVAELASYLSKEMNAKAGNRPINGCMGVHVAGYSKWKDGVQRPSLFHVTNGDGQYRIQCGIDLITRRETVQNKWESGPRRLFKANQDFPEDNLSVDESLSKLKQSHTTRNGHFFTYAVFWDKISEALQYLNRVPNLEIPKNSDKLGPRKGLIILILKFMITMQKLSSESNIVGGDPQCEALGESGFINT